MDSRALKVAAARKKLETFQRRKINQTSKSIEDDLPQEVHVGISSQERDVSHSPLNSYDMNQIPNQVSLFPYLSVNFLILGSSRSYRANYIQYEYNTNCDFILSKIK